MTIHHIGYLVKKLERARTAFEALGYGVERETVRDEFRKVDILFLVKDGYRVELVSPYDPSSVVAGLLTRTGNAPYHVCYEVDDILAARDRLKAGGARVLGDGNPKIGAHGKPVLFLHPKDFAGTLVELEQA